jgi:hypothetical protein
VDVSSLLFVVTLSVYLTPNFVISSLIVGTFKSVCKTLLDMYHGALTIAQRTSMKYVTNKIHNFMTCLFAVQRVSDLQPSSGINRYA